MSSYDSINGPVLSFKKEVAIEFGVNAAIIYSHIVYWLDYNKNNPNAKKDGRVWMYEKQEDIANFFEFMSEKEVRNAIKILVDRGVLIKGNFNSTPFDRTNWYTLDYEVIEKIFTKRPAGLFRKAPPGSSEKPDRAPLYKEEIITKEKHILTTTASPKTDSSENPTPRTVVVSEQRILFKNSRGQLQDIDESLIYRKFLNSGYPTEIICEAIQILRETESPISNIFRYIQGTCEKLSKANIICAKSIKKTEKERLKEESYNKRKEEYDRAPKFTSGISY